MIDSNNIPKHWQVRKLGEVCDEIKPGYASGEHNTTGKGILQFRPYNIDSFGNVDMTLKKFVPLKADRYFLKDGDVVFNNTNSPELLGKTCYIKNPKDWVYSNHMTRLRVKEEELLPKYCAVYLQLLFYQGYYRANCSNHVNQASISSSFLSKFIGIPLPPLSEQQAIVSKIEELFSDLDNGKKQLETAKQQLKVYRQSLLKWAFEGSWELKELGKVAEVKRGKSKHRPRDAKELYGGVYPFIQTGDIKAVKGGIVKSYSQTYSDLGLKQSKLWKKGTLCLTIAANIADTAFLGFDCCFPDSVVGIIANEDEVSLKFINFFIQKVKQEIESKASATAQKNINVAFLEKLLIPFSTISKQNEITQKLESCFTVCDKLEETIAQSLQQAETLRQSILKKAFEGKLVAVSDIEGNAQQAKVIPLYKPRNEYFYQLQILGIIARASKQNKIHHGEMTLAKYAYLVDKVYNIPTYYIYERWHLGPYPPAIKKAVNNKRFFQKSLGEIEVVNESILFKHNNAYQKQTEDAINELSGIFSKFKDRERSHKTELLATVCKVAEDIQTTDLRAVRKSMEEWKIELDDKRFNSKAEKFSETETQKCLQFLKEKEWDKKLVK